eukprot:jgi/Pico_ML_1/53646/g4155.t1
MNESQDRSTRLCTGVIHERFETTRGKDGRASVDASRTAICKRKEVSKLWIRTRQKDENRAVYHEEPTLSLSFVWLKEEDLLRSLTQTFLIELGQKTAKWVEPQLEDLVQSGLVRAATRFRSEDTWLGKKVILDEVFALYCVIQECRSQSRSLDQGP